MLRHFSLSEISSWHTYYYKQHATVIRASRDNKWQKIMIMSPLKQVFSFLLFSLSIYNAFNLLVDKSIFLKVVSDTVMTFHTVDICDKQAYLKIQYVKCTEIQNGS